MEAIDEITSLDLYHSDTEIDEFDKAMDYDIHDHIWLIPNYISRTNSEINCISSKTLMELMFGMYSRRVDEFKIIDCRLPYEYEGGHIKNSLNFFNRILVEELFDATVKINRSENFKLRKVFVFYYEFAMPGAPLITFWQSLEEIYRNKEKINAIALPQVFVLDRGYNEFFRIYEYLCEPKGYVSLLQKSYRSELAKYLERDIPEGFFCVHNDYVF